MRQELDNVLQCLSLNGYSVYSLINDVLAHGCDAEDRRIKSLREEIERDSVDICRLLNHNSASASVSTWTLSIAESLLTRPSEVEERIREERGLHFETSHPPSLTNHDVIPPGLSFGTASTPANSPEQWFSIGRARFVKYRRFVIIDPLPDDIFLEIFDLCLRNSSEHRLQCMRKWLSLAHVCQRWRRIIFASPCRLDLSLICTYGTPIGQNLVYWPLNFPLTIDLPGTSYCPDPTPDDVDNIVAALTHADRIHLINISATYSLFRKVVDVMHEVFPVLKYLSLSWDLEGSPALSPVLPEGFLGGSAPRLQELNLSRVSFPGLPMLLSSASNLVTLRLFGIFQISPEAMAAGLAGSTRLNDLYIAFYRWGSQPDQWRSHPNPPNRAILPALTQFHYDGHIEYLEDLLALIDMPLASSVRIEYVKESFMGEIQVPQLSRFISHAENLKLAQFHFAIVSFYSNNVHVSLKRPQVEPPRGFVELTLNFSSIHAPCVVHALRQLATIFSNVGHLSSHGDNEEWSGMDNTEWLLFLRLFPAVETMHLSGDLPLFIASVLEDTAEEMVTELLPALQLLELDEYIGPLGSMEKFLSLRQLSGRPVTVD